MGIRFFLNFIGLFKNLESSAWDEDIVEGIEYVEHHVLQIPFFLMSFMRYLSPAMDHMFMDSLAWVDQTYITKHKGENPDDLRAMYYPNLKLYEDGKKNREKKNPYDAFMAFLMRFGRKAALSLAVYVLSFLPVVGRFVLPAASFYTFNKAVGTPAAVIIFGSGIFVPKRYLVMFLQSYFSSRSMMRDLVCIIYPNFFYFMLTLKQLDPYFSRVRYTKEQKKRWFHDREGVLYGFAVAFFMLVKIPLVGVLVYGIAEASTAYLITKITEPPPPPSDAEQFKEKDVRWENKKEFLSLPLDAMDKFNISAKSKDYQRHDTTGELKKRQFT